MLREVTKKPHRVQVTISFTLICVQMYYFFKTTLIVVFKSHSVSLCSVAHLFSLFFNTVLKIIENIENFTDTILCHFTAVFHVVLRCFIIGRRYVENPARSVCEILA